MAPPATACAQTARSRSRSPRPSRSSVSRAAGGFAPQLKDWVLTRVSTRFWSKAVPALVSKVTEGTKTEDCSFGLVLPNRFALQYGFGNAKPFLELGNVSVRDVRPYHGTDHMQLHATLLKAIKNSRLGGLAAAAVEKGGDNEAPCIPALLQQHDEEEDERRGEEAKRSPGSPAGEEADDESEESEPTAKSCSLPTRRGEEADDESEESEPTARSCSLRMAETSGLLTPRRARPLVQRESEPKQSNIVAVEPAAVPVKKSAMVASARTRFLELTKAVACAFKDARAEELSRQELSKALGASFGEEELQRGLEQLGEANKVFLTGDLVFLV